MYIQLITIYLCYFHVKFEINSSENVYVTLKYLTWVNIFLFLVHLTSKSKVHAVIMQIYARVISILLFRCYVPSFKNYIQIKHQNFPKPLQTPPHSTTKIRITLPKKKNRFVYTGNEDKSLARKDNPITQEWKGRLKFEY